MYACVRDKKEGRGYTALNLILHMEKNNFNFEKRAIFW